MLLSSSPDQVRTTGAILATPAPSTKDTTSRVCGPCEKESSRPDWTRVSVSLASALSHPPGPTPRTAVSFELSSTRRRLALLP